MMAPYSTFRTSQGAAANIAVVATAALRFSLAISDTQQALAKHKCEVNERVRRSDFGGRATASWTATINRSVAGSRSRGLGLSELPTPHRSHSFH